MVGYGSSQFPPPDDPVTLDGTHLGVRCHIHHGGFPTPKQDECIGDAVHFHPHMQIQTKASYPSLFSTIFLIRHVHLWFHQAEGQANEITFTMMTGRLSIPASRSIENDNTLESVVCGLLVIFVESYAGRPTHHLEFVLQNLYSIPFYPPLPSKLQCQSKGESSIFLTSGSGNGKDWCLVYEG
jgi:hypothetical protein